MTDWWRWSGLLRRLMACHPKPDSIPATPHSSFWHMAFSSQKAYMQYRQTEQALFSKRRAFEAGLDASLPVNGRAYLKGWCWVCKGPRKFLYDRLYSSTGTVNWRERLVCQVCGLNNRLRMSAQLFESLSPTPVQHSRIYLTEQLTPFASFIRKKYFGTVFSEYIDENLPSGFVDARGLRHEDVTSLSLQDARIEYLLSFDVLEHVPNYRAALSEFFRVLVPGGVLLMSVPFLLNAQANVVRALRNEDGEIVHCLAPEYHGDPINPTDGILCYYHFGWELLNDLRLAGFQEVGVHLYWSLDYGIIGAEQLAIIARRRA